MPGARTRRCVGVRGVRRFARRRSSGRMRWTVHESLRLHAMPNLVPRSFDRVVRRTDQAWEQE